MDKIKSFDELKALNTKYKAEYDLQANSDKKYVIKVGMATCGIAAGAREVMDSLNKELTANNVTNASVKPTGCLGFCYAEPVVEVLTTGAPPVLYGGVDAVKAALIVKEHIIGGNPLKDAVVERGDLS